MSDNDKIDLSEFLSDYLNDAREGFQEVNSALLALEKDHSETALLDGIFRVVHTLKSSSTMMEFSDIAELAHVCEELLARLQKHELPVAQETLDVVFKLIDALEIMVRDRAVGTGSEVDDQAAAARAQVAVAQRIDKIRTVRVNVELLDALLNLAGEITIAKNRLDNVLSNAPQKEAKTALVAMDRMIAELQENVSAARLIPIDEIFRKFPKMVRDLAREEDKDIELVLEGSEIELDKAILDGISEPLIHLVRNAVDHGIEPAEIRRRRNKSPSGTVKLTTRRTESHVLIDVEDDGAGIDAARVKEVAVRKGFVESHKVESLQDKDVLSLLFISGFSGADEVTDLSGRGVGLDAVKNSVQRLGGTVEIATQEGKGSRFTLKLPLTTVIINILLARVGEHVFAIPCDIVSETLAIEPRDIKAVGNEQVLVLRDQVIPFVMLHEVLNIPRLEAEENLIAVISHRGDEFLGLGVDALLDQMEHIIKPLDLIAQQFTGISGGTILGDGRVALVLDIPALFGFATLLEEKYATA